MTARPMFTMILCAAATSGCQQPAVPAAAAATPISEADAAKIADATIATWLSRDAARIKAMYADDVAGYDSAAPALFADRASWDKMQEDFARIGMDGSKQRERKIQVLSPDVFVMSGAWDVTNSAQPRYNAALRCTVVYRRDAQGKWPITTEQCSTVPPPA